MNAPSTPGSSKAADTNGVGGQTGFRPQGPMVVQPPRQEDLQKSYASIVGNDADAKGWYGSMSKFTASGSQLSLLLRPMLIDVFFCQSTPLAPAWEP